MNWKRGLGIGLIFIGIFISLTARVLTGAVVGFSSKNYLGVLGVLLLVGGILLVFTSRRLGELVSVHEFESRIDRKEHDKKKVSLILDTSAILTYKNDTAQLEEFLHDYENVFVPDSVLDEINDNKIKELVEDNTETTEGYEKYRNVARNYLEKTEKPRIRKELLPYLTGEKSLDSLKSGTEKMRAYKSIKENSKRILKIMNREGIDVGVAEVAPEYVQGKMREYLKNCQVSDADIDVLALALYEARYGQHAIIGEKDIDFRQAIDLIKKEHPKIGKNLDYVEVYEKELAAA